MKGPMKWPGRVAIGLGTLMVLFSLVSMILDLTVIQSGLNSLLLLLPLASGAWAVMGGRKMIRNAKDEYRQYLWLQQSAKYWLS